MRRKKRPKRKLVHQQKDQEAYRKALTKFFHAVYAPGSIAGGIIKAYGKFG